MIDYSVPWQRPLTEVHQILAVGNFFNNGVNAIIRKCCDPSTQCRMRGATFKQELSCRREKALCLCSIIHYVQHCYGTVRFIIYNTNVSERKSGERVFLIWHRQDFNSALAVQQVIMLLFDHGINTKIFCGKKLYSYRVILFGLNF